jgi:osmotically-inducible protein OsmY
MLLTLRPKTLARPTTSRASKTMKGRLAAVQPKRERRRRWQPFVVGMAAGVAGMFVMNRRSKQPAAEQSMQHQSQSFTDVSRQPAGRSGGADAYAADDATTITDRVMSSVFRGLDIPVGELNVNTVDHVVYLRGHLDDESAVKEIERRAREVDGVRDVVNLINKPDVDATDVRLQRGIEHPVDGEPA